jgi:protein-L-isoaspartate(D-aspartate) O-methyltransferase
VSVEQARRAYAEEVRAVAHLTSDRLVEAYARVPRERFLGAGPWQIVRLLDGTDPYRATTDADPRHIYHDVAVALDPARQLNNGQPSALARWLDAAEIAAGEAVLHVGCGVGYYTAIMAEMVGPTGRVVGYEIDHELAARARELLVPWPQATVDASDGGQPQGSFDVVFVNAGATHVLPGWLAALRPGGRLIVPLTIHVPQFPAAGVGLMLRAQRAEGTWPVRVISQVGIYDCANARDPANEAELKSLLRPEAVTRIAAAQTEPHERGPACLAHLTGFCLQSAGEAGAPQA